MGGGGEDRDVLREGVRVLRSKYVKKKGCVEKGMCGERGCWGGGGRKECVEKRRC